MKKVRGYSVCDVTLLVFHFLSKIEKILRHTQREEIIPPTRSRRECVFFVCSDELEKDSLITERERSCVCHPYYVDV